MTPPYYSDDLVTLYHGDCRQVTEWLAADVLVVDPPYGVSYESNWNRDKRNQKVGRSLVDDSDASLRTQILALWGDRPALVFGRWNIEKPNRTRTRLIWDKVVCGMGDLSLPWGPSDEEIYVLGRGFTGVRSGSVIRCQMLMSGDSNRPAHPTPKPVPLMEMILTKCPTGVVADPCCGSGPTLVAAQLLGRRAIGVEIEECYCELIARRLDQGVLPFGEAS